MEPPTQNVLDFNKICRTCLSTDNLIPICGALHSDLTSIEFVLNKYAHIKFDPTDKLPKQICSRCFKRLNSAYRFLKNCDLINTALIDCLTRFEDSSQSDVTNSLEIIKNEIKNEPQESNNFEEIEIDCENEDPMTEIAPPLENIQEKGEPQVVVETFDEHIILAELNDCSEELCRENIHPSDFQNDVQIISDDSNSSASVVGSKTVLDGEHNKSTSKKTSRNKCILCDKQLFRTYKFNSIKVNNYCECRIEQCEICHKYFKNYKYLSKHIITHNTS